VALSLTLPSSNLKLLIGPGWQAKLSSSIRHEPRKLLTKTDGPVDKYTIDTGIIVDNYIIYTLAKRLVLPRFDVIRDLLPNRRRAAYATYAFFSIRSQKKNSSFKKLEKKFRGQCIARNHIGRRIRFHGCHCSRVIAAVNTLNSSYFQRKQFHRTRFHFHSFSFVDP